MSVFGRRLLATIRAGGSILRATRSTQPDFIVAARWQGGATLDRTNTCSRCGSAAAWTGGGWRNTSGAGSGGCSWQPWLHLGTVAIAFLLTDRRARCASAAGKRDKLGSNDVPLLSTPQQVEKIAGLINALVDMEYWTEEEEQLIFEHAVKLVLEAIELMLPRPILMLVIQSDEFDGLDEDSAEILRSRLVEYCKWKLKLPFLDETDEIRVITAVCAVIVESLKKGNSFKNVVEPVNSGELIMDVFVKGSVGLLDEQNKREFIQTIADGLQIPFLPDAPKIWLVGKMMTEVGMVFEESLLTTYQQRIAQAYDWAAERVNSARNTREFRALRNKRPHDGTPYSYFFLGRQRASPAAFLDDVPLFDAGRLWDNGDLVLPNNDSGKFGEEVRDKLVNSLNDRVNVIGWVCDLFERWEGVLIQKIVDITLLESMDMDKMEGSISFLCRENFAYALGYEWFECLKEEQLPHPAGWTQNEWYWEVAKELAKRDMSRIFTGERPVVLPASAVTRRRSDDAEGEAGGGSKEQKGEEEAALERHKSGSRSHDNSAHARH